MISTRHNKDNMNIIQRNFFTLLRSGTFGGRGRIEPMSPWKWNRLYQLSVMHGVVALVYDGICNHADDFFMQMPEAQRENWLKATEETEQANRRANEATARLMTTLSHGQLRPILLKGQSSAVLYDNPLHRTPGNIDIFFPYAKQGRKADEWARSNGYGHTAPSRHTLLYRWNGIETEHHHCMQHLTNKLLNRKLQNITEQEIRASDSAYATIDGTRVEVLPPTLNILHALIRITRYILNEGISMKQLTDLGIYLRKAGDKVDFVKLQTWIQKLGMQNMARFIGGMMVVLLGFEEDEIQFVNGKTDTDVESMIDEMFHISDSHNDSWYFTQGKNIFVRTNNSNAMLWQLRHSARYFRYYPSETVTNFFTSFAHSISHIEE